SGIMHLVGNMIFLMVIGTRVNALVGNTATIAFYPLLAAISGWAQMTSLANEPPAPSLGASGAIMGLAGMYLVLMPVHKVHMAFWFRMGLIGRFRHYFKLF